MLYRFTEAQLQETEKLETIRKLWLTSSDQEHSLPFETKAEANQSQTAKYLPASCGQG